MRKHSPKYRLKKIIIAGGGSGGHIYPALAIAETLKQTDPDVEILFVGAKGKIEMQKVPKAGYKIIGLWISGLQRSLSARNLLFPLKVIISFIKAVAIIRSFKPSIVVGVGGYASWPILRVAQWLNIPSLIQEQNSYAGLTNRMLAKKANKICVAFDNMNRFFPASKIIKTGNPIRGSFQINSEIRRDGFEYFQLDPNKKTLLVIGGSIGALSINNALLKNWKKLISSDIQIIWQTGNRYFEELSKRITSPSSNLKMMPFIERMDYAYACADLVISRAGAMAIAELSLLAKPTVFVPSPNVVDDHQTKNVLALTQENAALLIKDNEIEEKLSEIVIGKIHDDKELQSLSEKIKSFAKEDAAIAVVNEIISLANSRGKEVVLETTSSNHQVMAI